MQLQILSRHPGAGKSTKLQAVQTELAKRGINAPIIIGARMTTPYFLHLLVQEASSGTRHFLADECTHFQIKAVQELVEGGPVGLPSDFEIHLVRQA